MTHRKLGKLTQIWRYPVSSMGGEPLQQADCTVAGLAQDRALAVFDAHSLETANPARKRWQGVPRAFSRLGNQGVEVSLDGTFWQPFDDPQLHQRLSAAYDTPVTVLPYGIEVDGRLTTHRYELGPLHLLSQQSLHMLERLLPDSDVSVRRFRPNLVIDMPGHEGQTPPEYQLIGKTFTLGGVRLRGTRKAGRCSFTTLEQTGLAEDRDILRSLIAHFGKDFGIYCEVLEPGPLEVDMPLDVTLPARHLSSVLVIGAGQAGATAARTLRELGHSGPITLFGDEHHAPYERPPLSKVFEPGAAQQVMPTTVLDASTADALDIKLHLQTPVVRIDRAGQQIETADGRLHPYDHLVIATGGTPRRLADVSRGHRRVHSVRTLDDAMALQQALRDVRKVFIAGGGWLGLEIASALRAEDIEVTLFARQDHLCARVLPKAVSDYLVDAHRQQGTDLRLGQMPTFREQADRVVAERPDGQEHADLLVVAIGITANDWLARHAGLECRDGIITDSEGATSDPAIHAIGDVAVQVTAAAPGGVRHESWHNALEQSVRAARSILGLEPLPEAVPRFWSDQCGWQLQVAGVPAPGASAVAVEMSPTPLWRYEHFIVAIDRPRDVHQFAQQLQCADVEPGTTGLVATDAPSEPALVKYRLGDLTPPEPGQMAVATVESVGNLVIANVDDVYHAIQEQCPHADAPLSEGFIEGRRLVCPLHFAAFDLVNGLAHGAPSGCPNARTYKVEREDGQLFVWLPC